MFWVAYSPKVGILLVELWQVVYFLLYSCRFPRECGPEFAGFVLFSRLYFYTQPHSTCDVVLTVVALLYLQSTRNPVNLWLWPILKETHKNLCFECVPTFFSPSMLDSKLKRKNMGFNNGKHFLFWLRSGTKFQDYFLYFLFFILEGFNVNLTIFFLRTISWCSFFSPLPSTHHAKMYTNNK